MAENTPLANETEGSAIDDLRRIRERIDRESAGDMRKHVEESKRIAEEYRQKLGLIVVQPPQATRKPSGTEG